MDYKFAGVLPYSFRNDGKLVIVLGRERRVPGWSDSHRWSDFAGRREPGENPVRTAARECYEESMGFLGTEDDISRRLTYDLCITITKNHRLIGYIFLMEIDYQENLPSQYGWVYQYMTQCMRRGRDGVMEVPGCPDGLFEKDKMGYFTLERLMAINDKRRLRYNFSRTSLPLILDFFRVYL